MSFLSYCIASIAGLERGDQIQKFRNEKTSRSPLRRARRCGLKAVHRLTSCQFGSLRHGAVCRAIRRIVRLYGTRPNRDELLRNRTNTIQNAMQ